ncbi:hypothetical protein [Bacillus altitudinis]|uniref:Uncharacterized protein n=1 Tax=Bacillus altitudinis TaxID=293387 RepID=A0ABV1S9X4_BACAB|nr:hypothetical protein [Bacillus altitudinis]
MESVTEVKSFYKAMALIEEYLKKGKTVKIVPLFQGNEEYTYRIQTTSYGRGY